MVNEHKVSLFCLKERKKMIKNIKQNIFLLRHKKTPYEDILIRW